MITRVALLAVSIAMAIFSLALFIPVVRGTASSATGVEIGIDKEMVMKSDTDNRLPSYQRPDISQDKPLSLIGTMSLYLPLLENETGYIDPATERTALMAIYNSTNGESWSINSGWGSDAPYCNWYGIACDENEHVTILDLNGNNLFGTLPPEIGNLPKLTILRLSGWAKACPVGTFVPPVIYDPIPPEIGNLANLQYLDLGCNSITSLPAEIGNLSNLLYLNLAYSQIKSLPPEIGNLKNLQVLQLDFNQLQSLPPEFGNLMNLKELWVGANQLKSLPTELGNLENLQWLSLADNKLSGPIPAFLSHLHNLGALTLYNNPDLTCWETKAARDWALSLVSYEGPTCYFR